MSIITFCMTVLIYSYLLKAVFRIVYDIIHSYISQYYGIRNTNIIFCIKQTTTSERTTASEARAPAETRKAEKTTTATEADTTD